MSKPQPGSGSLEDILSSIRKSLTEQSTDALTEAPAPAPAADAKAPQRKDGLVGRLANATVGTQPARPQDARDDDLSDVLEARGSTPTRAAAPSPEPVSAPAPKAAPAASAPKPAEKDPLWFLTRQPGEAPASEPTSSVQEEPVITRPEVVRATLPPFFGSSTEAAKVEPLPPEPVSQGAQKAPAMPAPAAPRAAVDREPAKISDPALAREVSLVAAAVESAAGGPTAAAPPLNGAAGARTELPPPGSLQAPHALESVVLELLKPMLRQWLDENMPRLVAAALKGEADRAAAADANGKKP